MTTTELPEGAACMPNLSGGARRVRSRVAGGSAVVAGVALAVAIAVGASWWVRALVFFFPALVAAVAFFEARSRVCVVRARRGTYEHDDRSETPMDAASLPAIRRVARAIRVSGLLVALGATLAAALTSLVR